MSLPDLKPEPKSTLVLEISSTLPSLGSESSSSVATRLSSDDGSGIPTPTTTTETTQSELTSLPTTTDATTSSSSLHNVKFAPLPELLPRKRRSTVPLGMAGRGQLIHRRSGCKERNAPSLWTDVRSEEHRRQQEELAARHARSSAYAAYAAAREEEKDDEDDEDKDDWPRRRSKETDEDDPLLVLGRLVKVASKTLWKRVSNKDVAAIAAASSTPQPKEGSKGQTDAGNRDSNTGSPTPTKASRLPSPPLRPILGTISSNKASNVDDYHEEEHEEEEEEKEEGKVWEEEIEDSFPRNVSQTETIVEGRAVYSRLTSKVELLSKSPPPSPAVLKSKRMSTFTRPGTKTISPFKGS